jgi:hypothetical protein
MLEQQQVASPLEWGEILAPVQDLVRRAGEFGGAVDLSALAHLRQHLVQQATVAAYQDCFVVVALVCVAVMPLILFLRRQPTE